VHLRLGAYKDGSWNQLAHKCVKVADFGYNAYITQDFVKQSRSSNESKWAIRLINFICRS
jgi:hypothetical protein